MATIEVRNLSKDYKDGRIKALRGINFECQDGEFFCLLGPAGAGKTTTIKVVAGVESPDAGTVHLDGNPATDTLPWERDIAVAFESYNLYPQRTVRDNMSFPLRAPSRRDKWSSEAIEKRVAEIANLLGIGELLDRYPRQLSGGQRQRVGLGRALVRQPRAYLLDEPIAHLDAKLRHRMRGELKRIQRELGITTLYTTPDQLEALSLADTIAIINNGQIEQIGPPQEIYHNPANVFVAHFVGDPPMNVLEATLEGDELVVPNLTRLPVPASLRRVLSERLDDRGVKVGIRPKDLRVVDVSSYDANIRAHVEHVQVLGETSVLTLVADSTDLHAKLATSAAPRRATDIGLVVDLKECHFFDPETDRRIDVDTA